jgi:acetamidase/formamidase
VEEPLALFSCGDAHAAQGDGEVCVTRIEATMDEVTVRFTLEKGR